MSDGLPQYTHTDPLGSIIAVTGSDGTLLESRTYKPFGSSDVVGGEDHSLPNVNLFYEGTPDPILIGDIFDSPTPYTQTVEIQSPVDQDLVEGESWSPEIYLTIGDHPKPVRIPIAPVPLIMVTDLSPPFVTMSVDEKYLDPEGSVNQLNYTLNIDLGDPVEPQLNTVLTVELPKNLTITGSSHDYTDDNNFITWALGDLVDQNTTVTFQVDVTFTDNKNVLIAPHAELTSDQHPDPVSSNQTPTAIMNEGIAFFAEAYLQGTTTPTAYAKLNDPTYSTDFLCTLIYQGENSQNVRSFIAKETDPSTGLTYFGARYYEQYLGRFNSRDPIAGDLFTPATLNPYQYAINNPLRYSDYYGYTLWDWMTTGRWNPTEEEKIAAAEGLREANVVSQVAAGALHTATEVGATIADAALMTSFALVDQAANQLGYDLGGSETYEKIAVGGFYQDIAKKKSQGQYGVEEQLKTAGTMAVMAFPVTGVALTSYQLGTSIYEGDYVAMGENAAGLGMQMLAGKMVEGDVFSKQQLQVRLPNANKTVTENGIRNSAGRLIDAKTGRFIKDPKVEIKAIESSKHGNALETPGPHDVYVMRDAETGKIYHFGETGRGFELRGKEWTRKLKAEYDIDAIVQHLKTVEGKAAAKTLQTRYIITYEKIYRTRPGFVDENRNFILIQKTYQ